VLDVQDPGLVGKLHDLGVTWAFSAVPSEVALSLETRLVDGGFRVCSNASAHRRHADVPLVVADLNPQHLRVRPEGELLHACATNCTLIPLLLPYLALHRAFGVVSYHATSEQARSGAGYALLRGEVPLTPDIPGEAEKTMAELAWITGRLAQGRIEPATIDGRMRCQRVDEADGHIVDVVFELAQPVALQDVNAAIDAFSPHPDAAGLPSAPQKPLMRVECSVRREAHLWADGLGFPAEVNPAINLQAGMAVVVGDVEMEGPSRVRLRSLSHNTVRGAAGGVVLLAELASTQWS
jgi:aspartate-semialdehyde dehydrogenase